MESGHRFDAQTLHSFIQAVFRQMGSEEQEAKLVADHLIAANLAGHDSHGIGMIPSYVRSWSQGHLQINHHAKVVKEAGAAVTLDGDRAFGQVAAHEAMAYPRLVLPAFLFVLRHIEFVLEFFIKPARSAAAAKEFRIQRVDLKSTWACTVINQNRRILRHSDSL